MPLAYWITADRIHNGISFFPDPTYLQIDDAGLILTITNEAPAEPITHYDGWLCPGFINVHGHLELAHLKGLIPRHTGLAEFVRHIVQQRNTIELAERIPMIQKTIQEAHDKGTVAFGDICNSTDSILPKSHFKNIYFHSFIEVLGKKINIAPTTFERNIQLLEQFATALPEHNYQQTLAPHAPYSISDPLMQLINAHQPESIISIHSQETASEKQLFLQGDGPLKDFLTLIGIDAESIPTYPYNSLIWTLRHLSRSHPLILVHNTCIEQEDLDTLQARKELTYLCLCPNANLYIENNLPPVDLLVQSDLHICIGTDSLASNDDLSVLAEIKTIQRHFPGVSWERLLQWATSNGAHALGIQNQYGRLQEGRTPGIVHIPSDLNQSRLIVPPQY